MFAWQSEPCSCSNASKFFSPERLHEGTLRLASRLPRLIYRLNPPEPASLTRCFAMWRLISRLNSIRPCRAVPLLNTPETLSLS